MQDIFWNVSGATSVRGAVSEMRHDSPKAKANCAAFSLEDKIEAHRLLRPVMEELKRLARDSFYIDNGSEPYNAYCDKMFRIEQRRGYVKLILNQ